MFQYYILVHENNGTYFTNTPKTTSTNFMEAFKFAKVEHGVEAAREWKLYINNFLLVKVNSIDNKITKEAIDYARVNKRKIDDKIIMFSEYYEAQCKLKDDKAKLKKLKRRYDDNSVF